MRGPARAAALTAPAARAYRGDGTGRPAGLPPAPLPLVRDGRLRKQWRWVGVLTGDLAVVASRAQVGPAVQESWAVLERASGRLHERVRLRPGRVHLGHDRVVVADGRTRVDVLLHPRGTPVEVVTPEGRAWTWTRKRAGLPATGTVVLDGRRLDVDGLALVDDSAGHHARRTSWRWSAGCGLDTAGRVVAWNATAGLHDGTPSESTIWVDGVPREVPVPAFADDLSAVTWPDARLHCAVEAVRRREERLLVVRSSYTAPFVDVTGTLPGGVVLARASGVQERHDALW